RRAKQAYELKLGAISKLEARKAVERIHAQGIAKAGLISFSERPICGDADELLGPDDLTKIAKGA
ncbi:MAG: hypothetical protein QXG73_03645, partial [Candidatus Micrarchaeaceae archaeon]